jgi:hypothetical protein
MRGTLIAAWIVGESIVIWRVVHRDHRPPAPGLLLGVTVLFAALGAVAEYAPAAGLAAAVGWGLDIAAFMDVLPAGLGGQITQAEQAQAAGGAAGPAVGGSPRPVA